MSGSRSNRIPACRNPDNAMRHQKSDAVSVEVGLSATIDSQDPLNTADLTEHLSELVLILDEDLEGIHRFALPHHFAIASRQGGAQT